MCFAFALFSCVAPVKKKSGKKHFIGVKRSLETPKHSPPGQIKALRSKLYFTCWKCSTLEWTVGKAEPLSWPLECFANMAALNFAHQTRRLSQKRQNNIITSVCWNDSTEAKGDLHVFERREYIKKFHWKDYFSIDLLSHRLKRWGVQSVGTSLGNQRDAASSPV